MENFSVVASTNISSLKTEITAGKHIFYADEPVEDGGGDAGPSPYDILLSALGACTGMTLTLYARRRQIPLENVTVYLRHGKVYAEDCATCDKPESKIGIVYREIELRGNLSPEQRNHLVDIANKCPVSKTLASGAVIDTKLVPNGIS